MSDTAYGQQKTEELDVVFAETNGFTVSLPMHSPTVPAHMLGDENGGQNNEYFFNDNSHEDEKVKSQMEAGRRRRLESGRKQNSVEDIDTNLRQTAVQTDPGSYFLPPLIAKAIEKRNATASEDTSHLFERDKNSNLTIPEKNEGRAISSASSTQEATDDENVYLENADELFDDIQEKQFLTAPGKRALPEIDTSSIATYDSIDPIEDILVREDDSPADDRTFTLNGKAVITPKSPAVVEEQAEEVTVEVAEAPAPETYKDLHDLVAKKPDIFVFDPSRIHSHKVGKDSKCDVCKKPKTPAIVEETELVEKSESTLESAKPENTTKKTKPHKPIHSHKVGDDANCEHCSPNKEGEANIADVTPDLCCSIL